MLVVLTNYYYPEIGGCSNRITELTRELSDKVRVTVLCPIPSYPFNKALGNYKYRYAVEKVNDNLEVVRIKVPVYSSNRLQGRVLSEIILVFFALKYFCFNLRNDCDRVLTTSPPFFINFFGSFCKTVFRKEWIQDVRDLWPDSIIGTGVAKENSLTVKLLRLLEKAFYNSANKIVTVTEGMAGHIKGILPPGKRGSVYVVSNGCSNAMKEYALQRNNCNKDKKVNKKIVVGYMGNLGRAQDLELLVDIVKQAHKKEDKAAIKFMIVGEGSRKEWLAKELAGLNNVELLDGTGDKEKVAGYYKEIDVFIIPLKDHPVFETVIPTKAYELILFEKPFIHFTKGELETIGSQSGLGTFMDRINISGSLLNMSKNSIKNDFSVPEWEKLSEEYLRILNK